MSAAVSAAVMGMVIVKVPVPVPKTVLSVTSTLLQYWRLLIRRTQYEYQTIKGASLAPVPPRTAQAAANRTGAIGAAGLERQLMSFVKHVLWEPGAERVEVEIAGLAPIEEPLHAVAAQIADTLVLARALLSNHQTEVVLRVHEGGEGEWAGAADLMQIEITLMASESVTRPARHSATIAQLPFMR